MPTTPAKVRGGYPWQQLSLTVSQTNVTPIHKKGDLSVADSRRVVAVLLNPHRFSRNCRPISKKDFADALWGC